MPEVDPILPDDALPEDMNCDSDEIKLSEPRADDEGD